MLLMMVSFLEVKNWRSFVYSGLNIFKVKLRRMDKRILMLLMMVCFMMIDFWGWRIGKHRWYSRKFYLKIFRRSWREIFKDRIRQEDRANMMISMMVEIHNISRQVFWKLNNCEGMGDILHIMGWKFPRNPLEGPNNFDVINDGMFYENSVNEFPRVKNWNETRMS